VVGLGRQALDRISSTVACGSTVITVRTCEGMRRPSRNSADVGGPAARVASGCSRDRSRRAVPTGRDNPLWTRSGSTANSRVADRLCGRQCPPTRGSGADVDGVELVVLLAAVALEVPYAAHPTCARRGSAETRSSRSGGCRPARWWLPMVREHPAVGENEPPSDRIRAVWRTLR